jgi:hypothetical protein
VIDLPPSLATSMSHALSNGGLVIRPGRYDTGTSMCPLAAADAYAEAHGRGRFEGSGEERYGARLVCFAVSFDLSARELGLEPALRLVRNALARRQPKPSPRVSVSR